MAITDITGTIEADADLNAGFATHEATFDAFAANMNHLWFIQAWGEAVTTGTALKDRQFVFWVEQPTVVEGIRLVAENPGASQTVHAFLAEIDEDDAAVADGLDGLGQIDKSMTASATTRTSTAFDYSDPTGDRIIFRPGRRYRLHVKTDGGTMDGLWACLVVNSRRARR